MLDNMYTCVPVYLYVGEPDFVCMVDWFGGLVLLCLLVLLIVQRFRDGSWLAKSQLPHQPAHQLIDLVVRQNRHARSLGDHGKIVERIFAHKCRAGRVAVVWTN